MSRRDDLGDRLKRMDAQNGQAPPEEPAVPRQSRREHDPRRAYPIDVKRTALPTMNAVAWRAIEADNDPPSWFSVGAIPVRIRGGGEDDPVTTEEIGVDTLTYISARTAWWHKTTEKDGETEAFPLERVMKDMLAEPRKPLPPLRRIVTAPVFGRDGSLSLAAGYNAGSGNYYAANGLAVPAVPETPTVAEVEAAKALLLDELLGDFPFVSEAESAHALSLVLNPFVRDLIDGPTPMYLLEAPSAGTGKGLLAQMAMLPALGTPPVLMPPAGNEEETRKRITAALMTLPEAILLDNVADGLDSAALAAALTTPTWTDRVLGRSESRSIRVRATWMATGNNPTLSREMQRRVVRIRLDSRTERPEERKRFRHPRLTWWAADNRGQLVHAALTLVQRWIAADLPTGGYTLGSYETWADVHGGILDACEVPGFLANRRESEFAAVTEDAAWMQFVAAWWEQHRDQPVSANAIFELARDIPEFPLGSSPSERGQRTAFGRALSRNRDRVFNGRMIEHVGTVHRLATYRLRATEEMPF